MNSCPQTNGLRLAHQFGVLHLVLAVCASCLTASSQVDERLIPTAAQVGAAAMPGEIAPVSAPFAMPQFSRPKFPEMRVEVAPVGAEGLATQAIQSAIDDVSHKGGGTVVIPAGIWSTGRLVLKTNVNLHLSEGAELRFSGSIEDYQPAVFTRTEGVEVVSLGALVYAHGQQNIALTGKGKLIGPPMDAPLRTRKSPMSADKLDSDVPVSKRHYDGRDGGPIIRPVFFGPVNCRNVFVESVTFEKSPMWNVVPLYCDGVVIRGVTINSLEIGAGDGIDIDSSRNVLIEYCTFTTGDDAVAIKSGRGEDAKRVNKPSEFIVMRNCLVLKGHAGISTGSETGGMVRNLYVCDSVFVEPIVGIRFKTRRTRGGGGEHLYYERIRIGKCSTAIAWDMLGETKYMGEAASRLTPTPVTPFTPVYRDISINQVVIDQARVAVKVFGIPESPTTKALIQNLKANTSDRPVILTDVDGLVLRNAEIKSMNNTIEAVDARSIRFENCRFQVPGDKLQLTASGEHSKDIEFINCTPEVAKE